MIKLTYEANGVTESVTLADDGPTKDLEIYFLKVLRDKMPQNTYLRELFDGRLVDAASGAIACDHMPNVWDWYMRETARSAEFAQKARQAKSYAAHLERMVEMHEATIKNLTDALADQQEVNRANKERLSVLEDVVS